MNKHKTITDCVEAIKKLIPFNQPKINSELERLKEIAKSLPKYHVGQQIKYSRHHCYVSSIIISKDVLYNLITKSTGEVVKNIQEVELSPIKEGSDKKLNEAIEYLTSMGYTVSNETSHDGTLNNDEDYEKMCMCSNPKSNQDGKCANCGDSAW